MSRTWQESDEWWLNQHGKQVILEGLAHRLRCTTHEAIYPVKETRLSVDAEPVNKQSKHYQKIKRDLGDDWSVDVLSSPETEDSVRRQLVESHKD